MGEHRLPADLREPPVVVVPAPHAVGQAGQVLVHARAAGGEEPLEVDLVGEVRLGRQEVARDSTLELAGRRAVLRLHDPVGDESAEERQRRSATACEREVIGTNGVVPSPDEERNDGGEHERCGGPDPAAPALSGEKRNESEQEQHLGDRAHEDEGGDSGAERRRARRIRSFERSGKKPRDERERGREHGVARELMEERDVSGVEEQGGRGRDGCGRTEAPGDGAPPEDRERIESCGADLGHERSGLEQRPDDDGSPGRSRCERVGEDDVPVEELRVDDEISPQIPAGRQGERDGDEGVDGERRYDERRSRSRPVGKPLERAPRACEPRHCASVDASSPDLLNLACYGRRRSRTWRPSPRSPSSSPA